MYTIFLIAHFFIFKLSLKYNLCSEDERHILEWHEQMSKFLGELSL